MTVSTYIGLFIVSLALVKSERILRIGNDPVPGPQGLQQQSLILFDNVALQDGVLFGFTAFFRTLSRIHFQIWRPVQGTLNQYQQMGDWNVKPVVMDGREDIYIHTLPNGTCLRVKTGDRLGLLTLEIPGSVTYNFDSTSPQILRHDTGNLSRTITVGTLLEFDRLTYPYKFSAAAYIDAELSGYANPDNPACPVNIQIPPEGRTSFLQGTPGATGAQGATGMPGATGSSGPQGIPGIPGAIGATGQMGLAGTQGLIGPVGPTGPEGPPGVKGEAGPPGPPGRDGSGNVSETNSVVSAVSNDCEYCIIFTPQVMLGLIIWLALVTLILLITIACLICCRKNQSEFRGNLAGYDNNSWNTAKQPDRSYSYVEEGRTPF